jgi:hypothetical protein
MLRCTDHHPACCPGHRLREVTEFECDQVFVAGKRLIVVSWPELLIPR